MKDEQLFSRVKDGRKEKKKKNGRMIILFGLAAFYLPKIGGKQGENVSSQSV